MLINFMPGCGTADATFIVNHLQENFIEGNEILCLPFVHRTRNFDRVPHRMLWLTYAMGIMGVPEWIAAIVQAIYNKVKSRISGNGLYRDEKLVYIMVLC